MCFLFRIDNENENVQRKVGCNQTANGTHSSQNTKFKGNCDAYGGLFLS